METNQRLSDRMKSSNHPYGPGDLKWDQFVRDHKEWLKSQCTLKKFKTEEILQYRYQPVEFYESQGGRPTAAWVFMLLNGIATEMEFHEGRTQWYFPPTDLVPNLYRQYLSFSRSSGLP